MSLGLLWILPKIRIYACEGRNKKPKRSSATFNGSPDGYVPFLSYVYNQNNERLDDFDYQWEEAKYNYERKSESSGGYAYHTYLNLLEVKHPHSLTKYSFEKTTRNLGSDGFTEEYRVTERYDQIKKPYSGYGDFNHLNYSYDGDYTGYPKYINPGSISSSYRYSSTSSTQSTSLTNGLSKTTTFNYKGKELSVESKAANGERTIVTNLAFHSIFKNKPTKTETAVFEAGDTDATDSKLLSGMSYTSWGGIASETKPLTESQYNDPSIKELYTTKYTYDPVYYEPQTRTWYQNNSKLLSESYAYYTNGRLKSYTNSNNEVTGYCYNSVQENNISSNCTNPDTALNGQISMVKESKSLAGGKTAIKETYYGPESKYAYPSALKTYFTTRDIAGQTITQTIEKKMSYYIGTGLLKDETDSEGHKTSFVYDLLGRLIQVSYPTFTNLNGEKYEVMDKYAYFNTRVPSSSFSENDYVSSIRVTSQREYKQQSSGAVTVFSNVQSYYDGFGFLRYEKVDANQVTQYTPDDLTRVVSVKDPEGNTSYFSYDVWGTQNEMKDIYGNLYVTENKLKIRQSMSYFVGAENITAFRLDPTLKGLKSNYIEQDYDQWGQLLTTRTFKDWPNTNQPVIESYTYDIAGNVTTYIDPKKNINNEGVTEKYTYDPLNRLTKIKDALGQITSYQYDGNAQIYSMATQNNETDIPKVLKTKDFNEIGMLASKTDTASKIETNAYNNLGLNEWKSDRNGNKFSYMYDEQNRETITMATGTGITLLNKTIIGSNGIKWDRVERFTNNVLIASKTTAIDALKRVNNINFQETDGFTSSLTINYDLKNRVTSLASSGLANNFVTNYNFNGLRLDSVQVNGQSTITHSPTANVKYEYFSNGQVKRITYPTLSDGNTLTSDYLYDNSNRLDTLTNMKGATVLSLFKYGYDDNGNIISITQTIDGQGTRTNTYTYDKLNRLETVSRWDGSSTTYTYDLRGNRLTIIDTRNIPINVVETSYSYDLFDTLKSVTKGGVATSFEYEPNGLRYKKANGSNVTQYRYYINGEVIAEVNGSNQTVANYVHGDRLLVKKDIATHKDFYYLYNGHGDVIQIVDTYGQVVNSYEYDEWGQVSQQLEQIPNSFKYAGEILDNETGLYYLRARYYDPSIGRYINEDTYEGQINNPLSQNLYTYVLNNPLIYVDPSGHYCVSQDGNNAHGGQCNSDNSIYLGDDKDFMGRPIIENGILVSLLGSDVSINKPYGKSYWDVYRDDYSFVRWLAGDNEYYYSLDRDTQLRLRHKLLSGYMRDQISRGFPDFKDGVLWGATLGRGKAVSGLLGAAAKKKGQELRGGKKSQRDKWYGYDNKDFQRWWHREGKAANGGDDIDSAAEAKRAYDEWVALGKPEVK